MRPEADSAPTSPSLPKVVLGDGNAASPGSASSVGKVANGNALSPVVRPLSPPSFFGHDREEVTRILIQALMDLGYEDTAASLSRESGFEFESPGVTRFRTAVLQGDWAEAEALLFGNGARALDNGDEARHAENGSSTIHRRRGLALSRMARKDQMRFLMRRQKYLELLEQRDFVAALLVLREELTPLNQETDWLHSLSSLMMCQSVEDLKAQACWDGAAGSSRRTLLAQLSRSISPTVMIPCHRLADLFSEIKYFWVNKCLYHNTKASPSLYLDHHCDRARFPHRPLLEVQHHTDEVWFLKYSNDGSMLATTGKDQAINVYRTAHYDRCFTLREHKAGVTFLAWSPDDTKLVSCSQDNSAILWNMTTGQVIRTLDKMFGYPVTSAAWAPDGETFVTGSQDSQISLCVWTKDGVKLHIWARDSLEHERERGYVMRVNDVGITPDGDRLIALLEHHIVIYDYLTREKLYEHCFSDAQMTSLNISQDPRRFLVGMNSGLICMVHVATGNIMETYRGQKQSPYVIKSAFGGADENFVVSGSEDSLVHIWRTNGMLVERLGAHRSGCVSCVAWHPKNPAVFASAGDDWTVRIWSGDAVQTTMRASFGL